MAETLLAVFMAVTLSILLAAVFIPYLNQILNRELKVSSLYNFNVVEVYELMLVLIAIVIAFPVGWWAINKWLQSFAYRIAMGPGVFLIAATFIIISLLTISFQALKAAYANPVKSLRSE